MIYLYDTIVGLVKDWGEKTNQPIVSESITKNGLKTQSIYTSYK